MQKNIKKHKKTLFFLVYESPNKWSIDYLNFAKKHQKMGFSWAKKYLGYQKTTGRLLIYLLNIYYPKQFYIG